ncbi:MAG: helix-turn-helix domain-containing protein [Gemmobacter sp.]|uniref:helix-turn-helix domain-containing protein n=1 Tax=Gemmobacter sp. TaxID=1898957 RepID=UPI001A560601|nr:helix-turn-helix domain-containing protein [Gemmobacter sp.]MBL8563997.1 helix-turn-helix domain-containing protein [Gemmobacter sp.]
MPLNELTGSRLRERRIALGLRQAELAAAAGISASYLNLIEHNRRRVAGDVLLRLAGVLGVEVAALEAGSAAGLAEGLRAAAGEPGGEAVELDRLEEYLGRFPGWAGLTLGLQARVAQLERAVAALNDRIAHDPQLEQALHEVLSAVSSVRSTAGILAQTEDLDAEWRARFHANLYADSERLAQGAGSLVAYLEGTGEAAAPGGTSPEDELDQWLAGRDWQLAGEARFDGLSAPVAREMAARLVAQAEADAAALPEADFAAAMQAQAGDPLRLAQQFGAPVLAVMRRIALWPGAEAGLVICDAAGALIFRKPVAGFRPPRFGAACALWPVFAALARPGQPLATSIEVAGRRGERFAVRAWGEARHPGGFEGVEVRQAAMLLTPLPPVAPAPALRVGASCRICPEQACPARREASILG